MPYGHLCIVLHAHLPFVRHPEQNGFLEEDWLYEAITEVYIPLLELLDRLDRERIDYKLTLSISPPLAAMLSDELLQDRYVAHLDNLIQLSDKERLRHRFDNHLYDLASMYHQRFMQCRDLFDHKYDRNLLKAYRTMAEQGGVELITCCATHGFLPVLAPNPQSVQAQIEIGVSEFERHFGISPRGIWLPECGFVDGVDTLLKNAGLSYFFAEAHGVLHATPRPACGIYAPIKSPKSGVAAFARDQASVRQVWSATEGYPGDPSYREFHRDIGFDLDLEYLEPHLPDGERRWLGIKYYRITGKTENKQLYVPALAQQRAAEHAAQYLADRQLQVEKLSEAMDLPPVVVATYDAELFGHWWYEGQDFLEQLFRQMQSASDQITPVTASEYLENNPDCQESQPAMSTWGRNGYCEYWVDESNDWIYGHLHAISDRMVELASGPPPHDSLTHRAMNQAGRELLLAQSSDWAFIMRAGTMIDYAVQRTTAHISNFNSLYGQISDSAVDETDLRRLEETNNIFPQIDYRRWRAVSATPK